MGFAGDSDAMNLHPVELSGAAKQADPQNKCMSTILLAGYVAVAAELISAFQIEPQSGNYNPRHTRSSGLN